MFLFAHYFLVLSSSLKQQIIKVSASTGKKTFYREVSELRYQDRTHENKIYTFWSSQEVHQ